MNRDLILNYILYFFFYSNVGWFFESLYCSIAAKKWINRGFLTGPLCPIYGAGALVLNIFVSPFKDKWYLVFILGLVFCDIVEFITSVILEKLFHARWWDYSDKLLNIQGRICLRHSLIWGGSALLFVGYLHPFFESGFALIPTLFRNILLGIILSVFAIDLVYAVIAASDIRKFNKKLSEFGSVIANTAGNVISSMEGAVASIQSSILKQGKRIAVWTADMNAQFDDIRKQFDTIKAGEGSKRSKTARMFRASRELLNAPTSKVTAIGELLDEMKKRITDENDEML